MENSVFQSSGGCGEDLEQALMDLGPLLGVTIKEEAPDEPSDSSATARPNVSSVQDGAGASASEITSKGESADGVDSLASAAVSRTSFMSTKCVFCQSVLAQTDGIPKLMECLHSACEPCVKSRVEEKLTGSRDFLGAGRVSILCATCRLQCQPNNMIDQRFVLEKVAVEQAGTSGNINGEQQCNSCEDTEPATSYCVDCAEFICDNCVLAHQRLKITKDHSIKSKDEALNELQAAQSSSQAAHDMFCRDHPQERLTLFCETCDRLTCRDCQLHHHRDHKYQFSSEMATQARSNISALVSEVSYKRVLLGSAMKVIRDRQHLIAEKKKSLVHEITQTVVKLTNAINTRGKQLVLRLNEVCDSKQRTLGEKKEALQQLAAITDHCLRFVSAALEQGSDTAVLYSKRSVCSHLQRIKSRRADIPNPEIPVRITLALDSLPELIRVLSSLGAIVVDGKVDGGSASPGAAPAAAPTTAPQPPAAPAPAPAALPQVSVQYGSPHSAVLALQQAAMQQSFVGGVGGYMARARAHTPLRQPHVTSTTHPHHLHGMNEMNLRGLLNANARGSARPALTMHPHQTHQTHQPHQQPQHPQHVPHPYQHMMNAYGNNFGGASAGACAGVNSSGATSGRRSGGPRTPSPAPVSASTYPPAKWHIPQSGGADGGLMGGGVVMGGTDFKITLGRQQAPATPGRSALVTSTNPKTPSPGLNGGAMSGCGAGVLMGAGGGGLAGAGACELDKVCAESVQDLMATIAKLDSNGVQVVAESPAQASPAPPPAQPSPALVHSSTDSKSLGGVAGVVVRAGAGAGAAAVGGGGGAGDPNEDWCAVCMDGGELMCCDKCPKVFHQYCHIPAVEKLPDSTESWQCLLCVNFAEVPADSSGAESGELSGRRRRVVERVTLELYCQYELSLPFREPALYAVINHHPMCLDMIRVKLQPRTPDRYTHEAQFVADCRLLFRNAYRHNPTDSQMFKDARKLEEFFDAQLLKWLPEYAYWGGEGEPPAKRARVD